MQILKILDEYRANSTSEREKGENFERLIKVFFENDDIQKQYYSKVQAYGAWAKENGWSETDIGIDLVAELSDGSGYAAIQCKFYETSHSIQKTDIDSFISAASNDIFSQLILVDTTQKELKDYPKIGAELDFQN